ncbi:MAG: ABC transporter ATP-binding protein, partial [Chloroflexi bacterium]|nr:ABC transporter ATP-binding protein [Chloroflexota bacterium]
MGFFSGLDVEAYDRQYSDRQLLSRMGSYFRPYALLMVGIGLLSLFNAMAGAAVPLLLARALDLAGPAITAFQILVVTFVVLASGVLVWAANWWRRRLTARVIGDVVMDIRVDGFR